MQFDVHSFLSALTSTTYVKGAEVALALAVVAEASGIAIGFALALARLTRGRVVGSFVTTYIWIFRALPALLMLIITWDVLPQLIPALKDTWYTPFIAAYVALTIHEAAMTTEIFRAGFISIDNGQYLAARAIGLPPRTVLTRIIIPQVTRIVIPPMGNQLINQVKLTSLASVIALQELLTAADSQVALTFRYAEYYSAAAVYYLAIVSVFMIGQRQLEKRYQWVSKQKSQPGRTIRGRSNATASV